MVMMTKLLAFILGIHAVIVTNGFIPNPRGHTHIVPNGFGPSIRHDRTSLFLFEKFRKKPYVVDKDDDPQDINDTDIIRSDDDDDDDVNVNVNVNVKVNSLSAKEKAELLRQQAARARLEAERMDVELTLQKIAALEKKLADNKNKSSEETLDLQTQISRLTDKLNPPAPTTPTSGNSNDDNDNKNKSPYEFNPLTEEEIEQRIAQLQDTEPFLLDIVAKATGLNDCSDLRALALKLHEDQYFADVLVMRDNMTEFVPLTVMEIRKLEEGYLKLPEVVREMNEKQSGTSNVTEIVLQSFRENFDKKQEQKTNLNTSMSSSSKISNSKSSNIGGEGSWLFGNKPERNPKDGYVENILPKATRKDGHTPTEVDVQIFIDEVLDINTFTVPSNKAEEVPGGFVIRGYPRMEDYDAMIEAIDEKLEKSSISQKVQYSFMSDPTPVTDDQMEISGGREPVLFVCGRDLSPGANKIVTSVVTLAGLFFTFSISCAFFTLNDTVMDKFQADQAAGFPGDLDWLTPLVTPTFISFLTIQSIHEIAHKLYAIYNGFDTAFPILIPSPQLGTFGAITPLKTPAKNFKALFDFALVGPIAGILASLAVLYFGLELTAYADDATYALFPSVPLYFLKQSALGGGIIDSVFGPTLLSAADVNKLIPVHPLVISGLVSLLINGFSLTPFGGTDGGRMVLSAFGRTGALFEKIIALVILVFASLFTDQTAILVLVPFLVFFQGQLEIPCRNEVDGIDTPRGIAAVATAILFLLIVLPDV